MSIGRRGFFKALGGAFIGAAIVLKLPESVIPQRLRPDFIPPSYSTPYDLHVNRMKQAGFKPLSEIEYDTRMGLFRGAGGAFGKGQKFNCDFVTPYQVPLQLGEAGLDHPDVLDTVKRETSLAISDYELEKRKQELLRRIRARQAEKYARSKKSIKKLKAIAARGV